jgi:manganese oxidase
VALAAAPVASAALRVYWVAAVPAPTWNMAPNERDVINGIGLNPSQTVFPTVVYRRYPPHWGHPMRNAPQGSSNQDLIPGPLLRARVGDPLLVNFKNLDTLYKRPHSMHFHGVHYRPSSDGAYVPSTMIARRIEAAIQCTQPPAPSATS